MMTRDEMRRLRHTYILLLAAAVVSVCSGSQQLSYSIAEEKPIGYHVGSVTIDADFASSYDGMVPRDLRFVPTLSSLSLYGVRGMLKSDSSCLSVSQQTLNLHC